MAALKAALEADRAEEERRAAARLKLLDTGIRQAILTRSVDDAAAFLVEKTDRETADPAQRFNALRTVQDEWYESGRDKGLAFDLEVSIALALASLDRAQDADERGATQNNLGNALQTLGERESGTARLEEAVTAFRAALEERTQDRVPLNWAATTLNLGLAYASLFDKTGDQAWLDKALSAVRAAREVYDAAGATYYIEKSDRILADIEAKRHADGSR